MKQWGMMGKNKEVDLRLSTELQRGKSFRQVSDTKARLGGIKCWKMREELSGIDSDIQGFPRGREDKRQGDHFGDLKGQD